MFTENTAAQALPLPLWNRHLVKGVQAPSLAPNGICFPHTTSQQPTTQKHYIQALVPSLIFSTGTPVLIASWFKHSGVFTPKIELSCEPGPTGL